MDLTLINELQYSWKGWAQTYPLPLPLKDSLQLISDYFVNNTNNKLCIVLPAKEYFAQWLSIPLFLFLVQDDYAKYSSEIFESYKSYKPKDRLILNNKAIVEWIGIKEIKIGDSNIKGPSFRTNNSKDSPGAEFTVRFSDIVKLQKAPANRETLSSLKTVKQVLSIKEKTPIENLLNIDTSGNKDFIKNRICLVSKFNSYEDSIGNVLINNVEVSKYFDPQKIDENGIVNENSPFLITNNISNLIHYLDHSNPVSKIIIDGFNAVTSRSDLSDIDTKFRIPIILITDLSEIDIFEDIKNFGFEVFNFTKENITNTETSKQSPFYFFERKIINYVSFKLEGEVCRNAELEAISQKLHSLPKDDSNNDFNILKISLIQFSNLLGRICHVPDETEYLNFINKINNIEALYNKCRLWLGEAQKSIEEIISLLKNIIDQFSERILEKCIRLEKLIKLNSYDYIICPKEDQATLLRDYLNTTAIIISVSDINDSLLAGRNVKAILTGWPGSSEFNRIFSSCLLSELTVLFYQFENRYYTSLQRRNRRNCNNFNTTINKRGILSQNEKSGHNSFEELFSANTGIEMVDESSFDILEFELKLDNIQYSKYAAKENIFESCRAKRIDFENNTFIFATETHKFIVINKLLDPARENSNIDNKRFDALKSGDIIAFINTDRDILAEIVERQALKQEYDEIKSWIDLWKNLLWNKYAELNYDFKMLVKCLQSYGCKRHDVTIRIWLNDENMIGPEDDSDLKIIALMTDSYKMNSNIENIRSSIRQMTSWRMRASDFIRDKIKTKLMKIADRSLINSSVEIPELGQIAVLKVNELKREMEEIDKKYVNRLLVKEII